MAGLIASIREEDTERLFEARLGPDQHPGHWTLRVRQLEPWTEEQRDAWVAHIQDSFVHLAVVAGLRGGETDPRAPVFGGDVEMWEVDDWIEWRFGAIDIDPGSVTLLLNICEWGTFRIAPAVEVEVLAYGLSTGPEQPERPMPRRLSRLSFVTEEPGQTGEGLSIQIQLGRLPSGADVTRISHLLKPWYTALLRWGFALPALPTGMSEVRAASPPLVVAEDLWCYDFEVFAARYEAIDVLLNCLEWIHRSICPVKSVAIE